MSLDYQLELMKQTRASNDKKETENDHNASDMVTLISAKGKLSTDDDRDTIFCINEEKYYIKCNGSIRVYEKIVDEENESIVPIYKEGERILFIPERSINFVVRMTLKEFKEGHDDIAWDWEYDCLDPEDLKDKEKSDAPVIEPI